MNPELQEKDFIQERRGKDPSSFWIWLVLMALVAALLWGGRSWFLDQMQQRISLSPFLQVTNRQFSLFLWQHPEYMRAHARYKIGYLPGFQYGDAISVDPDLADQYVVAPPEVLFLYHTWHRLLGSTFFPEPISIVEFRDFLSANAEWQTRYWKDAPADYVKLLESVEKGDIPTNDLASLPESTLPKEVRQAFQGWKNYNKEGEEINALRPTFAEMSAFLQKNEHYARNYWRNIVEDPSQYLKTLSTGKFEASNTIPFQEVAPFLRQAFFNYKKKS